MFQNIWDNINTWLLAIASGAASLVLILIRKVNTNEKKIALLEAEIATREVYRKDRDEEFKSQLAELRSDVKALIISLR
jgi:hypothetical protein